MVVGVKTSYRVTPTWVEVGLDWIELKLGWMLGCVVTITIVTAKSKPNKSIVKLKVNLTKLS